MKLKTVHVPRGYAGLHCEIDGAIVNIWVGLHDDQGHRVTRIDVRADRYAGDSHWNIIDSNAGRMDFAALRLARETDDERNDRIDAEVRAAEDRIEAGQARWSETGSSRRR